MSDSYCQFDVIIVKMTQRAVLISMIEDEDEEWWVPMSCILEDDLAVMEEGTGMELNVAQWFCEKQGLV